MSTLEELEREITQLERLLAEKRAEYQRRLDELSQRMQQARGLP